MIRTAKTENGMVRGLPAADPRITTFKGIPFAAPPVGENRWRAPQPCKDWEGVLEAYQFAPISVQDTPGLGDDIYCREWHVDPEISMDEDCLYLNIWTGAQNADEKQPVLVWFFGGGFQWGYTPEMEFDGERIARRGVVVVEVNYRLGALGFMAHPEITATQPDAPANFGSLDQQAGLKWVVRNIAAFGGDPQNITIAGQSAGGASVMAQMTCEENYGLFQKAIVLSGMFQSLYEKYALITPSSLEEAEKLGSSFFEFLGVETLAQARKLDAFYIRDKYAAFRESHPFMSLIIDGKFCKDMPLKRFMQNKHAKVPVMAGNTEDEFLTAIKAESEEELVKMAQEIFGEDAKVFLQFAETKKKTESGYGTVSAIEGAVKAAFLQNEEYQNPESYYYRFTTDIPGWDNPGTFHSVDLWFFFETLAKCWRPFVGRHYDLSRQMCNYWTNFMKTGNPNGKDADGSDMPLWESYQKSHLSEMVFASEGAVAKKEDSEFMQFLIKHIRKFILED